MLENKFISLFYRIWVFNCKKRLFFLIHACVLFCFESSCQQHFSRMFPKLPHMQPESSLGRRMCKRGVRQVFYQTVYNFYYLRHSILWYKTCTAISWCALLGACNLLSTDFGALLKARNALGAGHLNYNAFQL